MKYYIFIVKYSQTDHVNVIVKAKTEKEAQELLQFKFKGARYYDYNGVSEYLIQA